MKILFLLLFVVSSAFAFIPPANLIFRDVCDGRKGGGSTELVLRHFVKGTTCEERILNAQGKYFFLWQCAGSLEVIAGSIEGNGLSTGNGERRSAYSQGLWAYYFASSGDSLRSLLLAERFINKRQLQQFEQDLDLALEPHQWKLKENYIRHPDVSLKLVGNDVAIAFQGSKAEGKAVFFNLKREGVSRLEWLTSEGPVAVQLSQFQKVSQDGLFARRQVYSLQGEDIFYSDFVSKYRLTDKQVILWLTNWKNARKNSNSPSDALNTVLRFR